MMGIAYKASSAMLPILAKERCSSSTCFRRCFRIILMIYRIIGAPIMMMSVSFGERMNIKVRYPKK